MNTANLVDIVPDAILVDLATEKVRVLKAVYSNEITSSVYQWAYVVRSKWWFKLFAFFDKYISGRPEYYGNKTNHSVTRRFP